MKLNEIKEVKIGLNNLNCLVKIEKMNDKIYFVDDTKGIYKLIENQKQLDLILENNKF